MTCASFHDVQYFISQKIRCYNKVCVCVWENLSESIASLQNETICKELIWFNEVRSLCTYTHISFHLMFCITLHTSTLPWAFCTQYTHIQHRTTHMHTYVHIWSTRISRCEWNVLCLRVFIHSFTKCSFSQCNARHSMNDTINWAELKTLS